jgi:hypothetical protein
MESSTRYLWRLVGEVRRFAIGRRLGMKLA